MKYIVITANGKHEFSLLNAAREMVKLYGGYILVYDAKGNFVKTHRDE